ncbi:MAG: hypothetical protein RI955_1256 [Bacteroidota bacterium]|jgi:hypothetical protein
MSAHTNTTDETTQRSKDLIVITFLAIAAFFLTTFVVLNMKGYQSPHKEGSERVISK